MQDNIEVLKELLDLGIITQDDYDIKIAQLSPLEPNAEETEEEKQEVFSVNYDELKKLEELKKEGILNHEEYSRKAAQLIGTDYQDKSNESSGNKTAGDGIKRNLLAIISIIALICVSVFAGIRIPELQNENEKLQSQVEYSQ